MICPTCNKETPSVFDYCQNCKADLRGFHAKREKLIEGTGEIAPVRGFRPEIVILTYLGPVGGVLLMVLAAVWFFAALEDGIIYFYPPVLFAIGLGGFFVTLKITLKRRKLKKAMAEDNAIKKSISGANQPR